MAGPDNTGCVQYATTFTAPCSFNARAASHRVFAVSMSTGTLSLVACALGRRPGFGTLIGPVITGPGVQVALSLLERDYEAELTASQVLDLSAMREALATGTDSRPYIKKPD